MKKLAIAISAIAALGCVNSAIAADLPVKAPAPVVAPIPFYNWTGLYIGINGGGGWASESWNDNAIGFGGAVVNPKPSGAVFGGQLGYRYQVNQFVFGIEGSGAWASLKGTTANAIYTEELKVKSLWTVTGQVGWAINRALLYVKGGWAGASTSASVTLASGNTASNSQTNNGWTVGVGLDYAIMPSWIVGIEYDHFDLNYGTFTAPFSGGGVPWIVTNTSRLRADQVIGRLSYQFKWP